jgi:hypothetical protein
MIDKMTRAQLRELAYRMGCPVFRSHTLKYVMVAVVRDAIEQAHAQALRENDEYDVLEQNRKWIARHDSLSCLSLGIERDHAEALAEDDRRRDVPSAIEAAYSEALAENAARFMIEQAARFGNHPRLEEYWRALHGDPSRSDLAASHRYAMNRLHTVALRYQPVVAPQLHPAPDNVKWDPEGALAGRFRANDRVTQQVLTRALCGEMPGPMTTLGVLARLRDAELRAARAESRVVELQARAVLSA